MLTPKQFRQKFNEVELLKNTMTPKSVDALYNIIYSCYKLRNYDKPLK